MKVEFEGLQLTLLKDEIESIGSQASTFIEDKPLLVIERQSVSSDDYFKQSDSILKKVLGVVYAKINNLDKIEGDMNAEIQASNEVIGIVEEAAKKLNSLSAPPNYLEYHKLLLEQLWMAKELFDAFIKGDQTRIERITVEIMGMKERVESAVKNIRGGG